MHLTRRPTTQSIVPDEQLVLRHQSGHPTAADELAMRWGHTVLNVAYRMMSNREDALDIRQIVLLRLYAGLDDLSATSLSSWIYRVTINACRDALRERHSRAERMREHGATISGHAAPCEPGAVLAECELAQMVAQSVAALPMAEREVVVLRHYHNVSFTDMATVLDVPISTLHSRLLRGLRRLRDQLGAPSEDSTRIS